MKYFLFLFLLLSEAVYSQQFFISGSVKDKSTGAALSYANIRVMNTSTGTTANKNGEYEIRLDAGTYRLITSFIGYNSDTLSINLKNNIRGINFNLVQTNINLPEITVKPGENPALRIIKRAMERKNERGNRLNSYEFDSYTKGIIKTQKDISSSGRGVSMGLGNDTSALKITGILENESKGFFKKPNLYKEEIIARRQSANFPPSINVLAGGRIIKNFYDEKISLFGEDLPGPLAGNALSYYYFSIKKTLAIDNLPVYEIHIEPDNPHDPGFVGNIFITDSAYDLIKVEVGINRAASIGGLFDSVKIFQQFSEFTDSIFMPVDYRIFVTANYLNLVKFGFELNTILYDFKINPPINDNVFSKAILTVIPGADKRDSTYWKDAVTIPSTTEEKAAYKRIDSLQSIPRTFWDDFSPLSTRINFTDEFSTSAPLAMYHFNRVEGNSLDFGMFLSRAADERLNSSLNLSYGFSDKKLKGSFNSSYLLGDYRTYKLAFNAFNKLNVLFGISDNYNDLTSTVLALASKDDFRDYYYSKGFNINFSGDVFPVLSLNGGLSSITDNNAFKNTEFSFFAKDKSFRLNPPIFETKINSLSFGFNFDFRDYIEDGFFRRRTSLGKSYFTFGGSIEYSDKNLLSSDLNFKTYQFNAGGIINTFNSARLLIKVFGMYTEGFLPYQMLYSLPGNINLTAQNNTFRTLNLNEVLGSRVVTLNIEHNFGDELFRLLNIPGVKDWELQLTTYLNIAYSEINDKSKAISPYPVTTFKHPFIEAGFGIGQVLFPMELDFSWRLNYRGENNFRIGINSFVF